MVNLPLSLFFYCFIYSYYITILIAAIKRYYLLLLLLMNEAQKTDCLFMG